MTDSCVVRNYCLLGVLLMYSAGKSGPWGERVLLLQHEGSQEPDGDADQSSHGFRLLEDHPERQRDVSA